MPDIRVINLTSAPLHQARFMRAARAAIRAEGRKAPARVVIAVVGDAEMRRLHNSATGKRSTTDVLAWPMALHGEPDQIAVCLDTARREAAARGHPLHAELALYVIHGILHLAGHDDHAPQARARMWKRQAEILSGLGIRLQERV